MNALTVDKAQEKLPELIEDVLLNSVRTLIVSDEGNVMMVSQKDWESMVESLRVLGDPTIMKSLREGYEARKQGKKPEGKPLEEISHGL